MLQVHPVYALKNQAHPQTPLVQKKKATTSSESVSFQAILERSMQQK